MSLMTGCPWVLQDPIGYTDRPYLVWEEATRGYEYRKARVNRGHLEN